MYFFIILFFIVPFAEISFLISVGSYVGTLNTIALVLATAVLGGILIRLQGTEILWLVRLKLTEGRLPAEELFSGFLLVVSGVLLCTPGFFTDSLGFVLLVPWIRSKCSQMIKKRIFGNTESWSDAKVAGGRSVYERDRSGHTFLGEIEISEDKEG